MAKTREKIIVPYYNSLKIAEAFGCSKAQVANALCFRRNSPMAVKIRHVALTEYGGQLVEVPI